MNDPDFRQAAILLSAVDAVLCDDMEVDKAVWFARRLATAVDSDPMWANGRHDGDCTKQPHSCIRCQIEAYEADAKKRYEE